MAETEGKQQVEEENTRLREEVTHYRKVMDNLSIHERMFHTLFESGHDAVFLLEGTLIRDSNIRSVEIFQYNQEELSGNDILTLSPEGEGFGQNNQQLIAFFNETAKRGTHFFEWKFRRKNGTVFPGEVSLATFEMNEIRYYLASIRDISLQKEIENDLKTRTAQLQSTLESLPFDFWLNDNQNRTLLQNSYSKQLWGDTHGKYMEEVTPDERIKKTWRETNERALKGEVTETEIAYNLSDGKHIYRNIVGPIWDEGKVIGILGLNIEVTDYKNTHNKLEKMVQEREILLREIHHRVKNNLQIIVSMINLQKESLHKTEVKALQEVENRISSMALIHDHLYNSENLETIYMPDYFESLADTVLSAFDLHRSGLELNIDSSPLSFSIDKAIPVGLIVNELLTNCITHAFVGMDWGTITLKLKKEEDSEQERCRLTVSDNGIGPISNPLSNTGKGGLGLTLVDQLTHQLGGSIDYEAAFNTPLRGSRFNVTFGCATNTLREEPLGPQ